ncbi:MAG: peptidase, partial [Lachnospiraceae bacterium]|nr:peptidase [Lachnospiraceae bacterium]
MNKWIEAHADEQLELLKTLAAIPAPSHIEDRRVMFLLNWLENIGIENAYADEAKNVIVPFAAPDAEGITIYTAHTDVVFPDVMPLPVVQDGDILRAPGVGDDTANVVGILMLLKYI